MDDRTITISISESGQAFIEARVASGRYASGSEVVRAGLAALENAETMRHPRAEDDREDMGKLGDEPASLTDYLSGNAKHLKLVLQASEASGESTRDIPQIMNAVKSKLRVNGSL